MSRRTLMLGAAASGALAISPARAEGPTLTGDGLYREPWFLQSFLNLGDDLETAKSEGKRFAIMWELKGCPYCKETHFVNFAQERIADYVKANFDDHPAQYHRFAQGRRFRRQRIAGKGAGREIRRASRRRSSSSPKTPPP